MSEVKIEEQPSEHNIAPLTPQSFLETPALNELLATQLHGSKDVTELAQMLLDTGADPNFVFSGIFTGLTPLALACSANNVAAVKLLMAKGAKVDKNVVFSIKSVEVAELLLKESDLLLRDNYGNTLLHIACILNNTELAKFYLERGLRLDTKNKFEQTPVHYACSGLISVSRDRPIPVAVKSSKQVKKEETFEAMGPGHQRARAVLTEYSQPARKVKIVSGTPRELNLPLVQLFLEQGGRFDEADIFGWTALDYAEDSGKDWKVKIDNILFGKKYDEHELFQTLRDGKSELVMTYLAEGNDPDISLRCETLAHIATNNGDCVALGALIERKAKIDRRLTPSAFELDCLHGFTPLYSVCNIMGSEARLQAMRMLIAAGANVNTPCDQYLTPFLVLCKTGLRWAVREMIRVASDQLISGNILPRFPQNKVRIRHQFDFSKSPTRDDVGNETLKLLCQMFIDEENEINKAHAEAELTMSVYQKAQESRKEALRHFEQERKKFEENQSSEQALDSALEHYLHQSKECTNARAQMVHANNCASDLVVYHQSDEYKTVHQQLGEVIHCLASQIDCNAEVQNLIHSNESLRQVTEKTKSVSAIK